jgi:hypothetical protein
MIIWTDVQLSPSIAVWMTANFDVTAFSLRDAEVFATAKAQGIIRRFYIICETESYHTSMFIKLAWDQTAIVMAKTKIFTNWRVSS